MSLVIGKFNQVTVPHLLDPVDRMSITTWILQERRIAGWIRSSLEKVEMQAGRSRCGSETTANTTWSKRISVQRKTFSVFVEDLVDAITGELHLSSRPRIQLFERVHRVNLW